MSVPNMKFPCLILSLGEVCIDTNATDATIADDQQSMIA